MVQILDCLNQWATTYLPLIQLLTFVAVAGATITALWMAKLARDEARVHISYVCEISGIYLPRRGDPGLYDLAREMVTATLVNTGARPTRIPWQAFSFSVPFARIAGLMNPVTDYSKEAPLVHAPGTQLSFELRSPNQLREEVLGLGLRWFPRTRTALVRFHVATEANEVFRARIGKKLRAHIREIAAELPWIYREPQNGDQDESAP